MGDATFTVKDVKLGRQMSTVHITLTQEGREEVVAYLTNSNMATESGITLQTGWSPNPPLPPPPDDFAKLATDGEDANWVLHRSLPYMKVRKAMNRVRIHIPRGGQAQPNVIDEWLRLESGERFTTEAVGFVCDMWPQVLEELLVRQLGKKKSDGSDPAWLWYPTVTLNLDFKKVLPPEGVDWLHVRIQAKQIKNGRYDYEIVIFDDTGDIVALSHHVVMVVDASRNTAPRKDGSKI
ncbi:thioesterase-like superfamily-domain-containing protein [Xylaria sp. CBS 124048]|nr:thioesterase-like superfamily-domain-containing protein [Xylaria sp. CBS 124048]